MPRHSRRSCDETQPSPPARVSKKKKRGGGEIEREKETKREKNEGGKNEVKTAIPIPAQPCFA